MGKKSGRIWCWWNSNYFCKQWGFKKRVRYIFNEKIVEKVSIQVIAHGGAEIKTNLWCYQAYKSKWCRIASMLHYDAIKFLPKVKTKIGNTTFLESVKKRLKEKNTIKQIKSFLKKKNIKIRNEK